MKQEIEKLQANEVVLQEKLNSIRSDKETLQHSVASIEAENSHLKEKIDELTVGVETLQLAENELNTMVTALNEKIQAAADQATKDQLSRLEQLHTETQQQLTSLAGKLADLEIGLKQCSTFGIFSYIEKGDQATFINTVEEAVAKDMTYSQINEYLKSNLSPKLDKIIKDHPSLTKTYIRNLRKE